MFKLKPNDFARTLDPLETTIYRGGAEIISPLVNEWRALCAEGICHQPFYQPEWIQCYVQAFAADQTLLLLTVRRQGKLRGVLPLIEERSTFHGVPVNKLRSASNVHSCRFDIVLGVELDPQAVLLALWQTLKQVPDWDVIELQDVPTAGQGLLLCNIARYDGFPVGQWAMQPGPYLSLPAGTTTLDEALCQVNSGFRSKLRQYKRQLKARGDLKLQVYETAEVEALHRFFQLEASGWKGDEGTAIGCHQDTRDFYLHLATTFAEQKAFRLYCLELDGQLIAAQIGILQNGCFYALKTSYDEGFRRYTPGNLLVAEILQDLISLHVIEFDFLGAAAEWKRRWSKQVRAQGHFYIFQASILGTALQQYKFKVLRPLREFKHLLENRQAAPKSLSRSKHGNQHSATHLSQDSPRNSNEEKLCR